MRKLMTAKLSEPKVYRPLPPKALQDNKSNNIPLANITEELEDVCTEPGEYHLFVSIYNCDIYKIVSFDRLVTISPSQWDISH